MWCRLVVGLGALLCMLLGCGEGGRATPPTEEAGPVGGYTSTPARIYVDGQSDDWTALPVRHADTSATADEMGAIDRVWTAHSDRYFFLRVTLSRSVHLQEESDLTLFLDTDNDPTTGRSAAGLGAEVVWRFGERRGTGYGSAIGHEALGLHVLPTVRADAFEMALDRTAQPNGTPLFPGDSLRVALSSANDCIPDAGDGLGYVLTDAALPLDAPALAPPEAADVRVFSQNAVNNFETEQNAIFEAHRQPRYRRLLAATAPDVVALQEVYDQTAAAVEQTAETALDLPTDWEWAKKGADLVLGSRFPIRATHAIPGFQSVESGAFLVDARPALGTPLIVVVMHPPCCNRPGEGDTPSRNGQRQRVVDGVAAFLRDVTNGDGPFGSPTQTPIVVVGDMNFVGKPQQPRTLRTGDIVHTDRFGPAAAPDWDGTDLLDVNQRQTGTPLHTTWVDSASAFAPGRLDYAYVTDGVVDVPHAFVLNTRGLSPEERAAHGLKEDDTARASDHLPVVLDLAAQ